MNTILKLVLSAIILISSLNSVAQKTDEVCYNPNLVKDTSKKSIKSMAYAIVNGDSIKINYQPILSGKANLRKRKQQMIKRTAHILNPGN